MFPSPCFHVYFEVSHQKQVMEIFNKNPLICQKAFAVAWGGFWLMQKSVNANNGRWKRICQVNSCMHIKINDFARWDGKTWLTSGQIFFPQHLKCYDNFEMHEQKSIKVLLYNCLPELLHDCILKKQASITKSNLFCLVCSLWGASPLLYMKMIIFSGFSYFLSDL